MFTWLTKKARLLKAIVSIVTIQFILTSIPAYAYKNLDQLRPTAASQTDGGGVVDRIKKDLSNARNDGGAVIPKTVAVEQGKIFGPALNIKFGIQDNIWQIGTLTMDGKTKAGNDRTLKDIEKLFSDQKAITDFIAKNGDKTIYRMFRDLSLTEADKEIIRANNLRCDITVIPPFEIGNEPIKTAGHYHPSPDDPNRNDGSLAKPGIDKSYTEVYVVLSGEAIYYLQKIDKDGNVVDAVAIHAKAGDIVPIPSTYGHITVNPSTDKSLVMMNWVSDAFSSTYGEILKLNGAAYYFVKDNGNIKTVLNPAYTGKKIAPLRDGTVSAALAESIGLPKDKPVYEVIHRLPDLKKLFAFLNEPSFSLSKEFDEVLGRTADYKEKVNTGIEMYKASTRTMDTTNVIREKISTLDAKVIVPFTGVSFNNFLDSLKGVKGENRGAFVIGADTVLNNVGTMAVLRKIKDTRVGIKIAVWAKDELTVRKLKVLEVDKIADIITAGGLADALSQLSKYGIARANIVVYNSPADLENINKDVTAKRLAKTDLAEIQTINLKASTATGVNNMALAFANGVTRILPNEKAVVTGYNDLGRDSVKNKRISQEDLVKLNDLNSKITEMPLAKATEEEVHAQVAYEETVNKD